MDAVNVLLVKRGWLLYVYQFFGKKVDGNNGLEMEKQQIHTNMDFIATYIEQNLDDVEDIHEKLDEQLKHLKYLRYCKNTNDQIVAHVHKIIDENQVEMLMERCCEIACNNQDKNNWIISAGNIAIIQTYMNLKTKSEIDLLNTLHYIHVSRKIVSYYNETWTFDIWFALNRCNYDIKIGGNDRYNECDYSIISHEISHGTKYDKLGGKLNKSCVKYAFQSAMTFNEYETFLNKLIHTIVSCYWRLSRDDYMPHYPPTINIANLLLCAMNEQELSDKTLTYSTMSVVEKVLYDVFLLKCITEKF
jgi:hypothetical protein